jgi:type I restriction enzyme M protein
MQPTTALSLGVLLKSARSIVRKDVGLNGKRDRLAMLTWDYVSEIPRRLEIQREGEARLAGKKFEPVVEPPYRWRDWAPQTDGIVGDEIIDSFGGADQLRTAVNQLQSLLYAA